MEDFSVLPFGPIEDPVRNLLLATTWPKLSEHLVTETETYSDLDPLQVSPFKLVISLICKLLYSG